MNRMWTWTLDNRPDFPSLLCYRIWCFWILLPVMLANSYANGHSGPQSEYSHSKLNWSCCKAKIRDGMENIIRRLERVWTEMKQQHCEESWKCLCWLTESQCSSDQILFGLKLKLIWQSLLPTKCILSKATQMTTQLYVLNIIYTFIKFNNGFWGWPYVQLINILWTKKNSLYRKMQIHWLKIDYFRSLIKSPFSRSLSVMDISWKWREHGGVSDSNGQTRAHTSCVLERQAATESSGCPTSQLHSKH